MSLRETGFQMYHISFVVENQVQGEWKEGGKGTATSGTRTQHCGNATAPPPHPKCELQEAVAPAQGHSLLTLVVSQPIEFLNTSREQSR